MLQLNLDAANKEKDTMAYRLSEASKKIIKAKENNKQTKIKVEKVTDNTKTLSELRELLLSLQNRKQPSTNIKDVSKMQKLQGNIVKSIERTCTNVNTFKIFLTPSFGLVSCFMAIGLFSGFFMNVVSISLFWFAAVLMLCCSLIMYY